MDNTTQYKDLPEFLAKHNAKSDKNDGANILSTHNRIPDKELNVFGGSYIIPREDLPQFYKLYGEHVFEKKKMEYLTERQLETNCPILLDFDFRYNYDVDTRQHKKDHVSDIITDGYLELLKEFFVFTNKCSFPIYVMEKPNVNRLADKSLTKDGIHMIIGIQMDHTIQVMLRDKIVKKIGDIWELPLTNDWDSVLDEGISKGVTNWQMYGSQKPGNEAYRLSYHLMVEMNAEEKDFVTEAKNIKAFDLSKDLHLLSAQYGGHVKFDMNPNILEAYNQRKESKGSKIKKSGSKGKINLVLDGQDDTNLQLSDIKNLEMLTKAVDNIMSNLRNNEYFIKEIHDYAQILPAKYYEPGSHLLNRQVAFALKHTDERLFLSWVMLRSKASDFDYETIPNLYNIWKFHFNRRPDGVTRRSIMYWAKQDASPARRRRAGSCPSRQPGRCRLWKRAGGCTAWYRGSPCPM